VRPARAWLSLTANGSGNDGETVGSQWNRFAIFEPISQDPQGKLLDPRYGLFMRVAVDHNARQIGDLGDPPTIVLLLGLDL